MTFQMPLNSPSKDFLSCKSGGERNVHLIWSRRLIWNLLWGLCAEEWSSCLEDYRCPHSAHRQPSQQCPSVSRRSEPSRWTQLTGDIDIDHFVISASRDGGCCAKTPTRGTKIEVLIDATRQRLQSSNNRSTICASRIPAGDTLFLSFNELRMTFIVGLF